MDKIRIYLLTFLLLLTATSVYSQVNTSRSTYTNDKGSDIFYHTIERGQTVYSIATMYGVTVDDIYRLNPESRTVIKAGETLRIPQQGELASRTTGLEDGYIYHTIQPRETLYALSLKYEVEATVIMTANPGLSVQTFNIGKTIRIPIEVTQTQATTPKITTKLMNYRVERRETLYNLTRKFNITSDELFTLNPELRDGVKAGMVIKVPVEVEVLPGEESERLDEREVNALLSQTQRAQPLDRIQVALLLPFMSDQARVSSNTARFVEYYEGLLMAVDSMRNMGLAIELSVYDIGSTTAQLNRVLNESNVQNAHLIIGGVQNEQIKPIADFAKQHNIKYVIPFTSSNDEMLSNANVFQVNTPHSYLYAGAAQAAGNLFASDNIVIVNISDSEEKPDFIRAFKTEMQFRNIPFREMTYSAATFTEEIETYLDLEKRNVILPTSASLDAVNSIKSTMRMFSEMKVEERDTYRVTLFGYPEWQTYTRECLEDFYALNTYIYTFFYADNLLPDVQSFYNKFKNWYSKNLINSFPKYGILGFDTGMFFFSALRTYGLNFENNPDKINYKGLQTEFNFERVNNWGGFINTNTFIVQYRNDNTVTRTSVK